MPLIPCDDYHPGGDLRPIPNNPLSQKLTLFIPLKYILDLFVPDLFITGAPHCGAISLGVDLRMLKIPYCSILGGILGRALPRLQSTKWPILGALFPRGGPIPDPVLTGSPFGGIPRECPTHRSRCWTHLARNRKTLHPKPQTINHKP
jgi:hypothetical protein